MKALYTADLHLTALADDEYRWGVFDWMLAHASNERLDCIWIIGDLTDRKDEHPARLVLRLCAQLERLAQRCPVYVVKGNHDYKDEDSPFFAFLDRHDNVRFFDKPTNVRLGGLRYRVLPHAQDWRPYAEYNYSAFDRIIFHQAIKGAVGDNGHPLGKGMPARAFDSLREGGICLGGDIHTPQTIGRARYVGSPHPIHFGDGYAPGGVLERDGKLRQLRRTTIRKEILNLSDPEELAKAGLTAGDWARVTITLPRSELVHWDRHKARVAAIAKEQGVLLRSVRLAARQPRKRLSDAGARQEGRALDPLATFDRFAATRGIDASVAAQGRRLLQEQ